MLDLFFVDFPLTKMEKETGLCVSIWRASATQELNSANHIGHTSIDAWSVYRSLVSFDKLNVTFGGPDLQCFETLVKKNRNLIW